MGKKNEKNLIFSKKYLVKWNNCHIFAAANEK